MLAEGAVVRSYGTGVDVGTGSAVLENSVVIGTSKIPTSIGRRSVFGHRCMIVGATVGDLCEIGNASVLMPGARLGNRVFLGEGTLVPAGMTLPSDVVAVGRPARIVRTASAEDLRAACRFARRRPVGSAANRDHRPKHTGEDCDGPALRIPRHRSDASPRRRPLFPTAEITGDVVVGERTIIGAGVKIIGDSHGPVRIGNDVQILENTVLHLLPDTDLIIDDGVIVGPGAMIHGCRIGAGIGHRTRRDRV